MRYAPKWLYGDGLRGLRYPLWASDYGSNPTAWSNAQDLWIGFGRAREGRTFPNDPLMVPE